MKRALVLATTLGLSLTTGACGPPSPASASAPAQAHTHSTIVGHRCTSDPVNGGRVCANVHWTPRSERHAQHLFRADALHIVGSYDVTYIGYTYRDIENGENLRAIREHGHWYLFELVAS